MNYEQAMYKVNEEVYDERIRQMVKWGKQKHDNGKWLAILVEEVGEAAQAMQQGSASSKETDASDLYEELIHTAAVASAWAEQVLRDMQKD